MPLAEYGNRPNGVRAVIMDVDGTLYRQSPVRRRMALRLLQFALANPVEGWRTLRALKAYRQAQEQIRLGTTGNLASRQIEVAAATAEQSPQEIQRAVHRWMETEPLAAVRQARFPGVVEFCEWIRSVGLPLGVLSDYPAQDKLRALELTPFISAVVTAQDSDVNSFKPNPAGLLKILRQLDVPADSALYIGDRAEVDSAVAAAAGVPGILIGERRSQPEPEARAFASWSALQAWLQEQLSKQT